MASGISSLLGAAGIGGAIGKAIVSLELDTKAYQAQLGAAEGQTKTSTDAMSSSTSKLGGIASKAFAAAEVALIAWVTTGVKSAIAYNEAALKLGNTFENNRRLSDSSVAAFEAQAESLRSLTAVDSAAILQGQALLGSFKLTGDEVMQLTPLVVDLAEKYDLNLQSAFRTVGKATAGSDTVLKKYGITLDETKLKADPVAEVLRGLGSAEGYAAEQADSQPWKLFASDVQELGRQLGEKLLPFLQDVAEVMRDNLIPFLGFVADNFNAVLAVLVGFNVVKFLPELLISIGSALQNLGAESIAARIEQTAVAVGTLGIAISTAASVDIAGLVYLLQKIVTHADPTFANDLGIALAGIAEELPGLKQKLDDLPPTLEQVAKHEENAADRAQRFGHMSRKAFGDFKDAVVESVQVTIGEFKHLDDAFDITTQQLANQARAAVRIAQQEQRDLRTIFADKSLSDAQKEALAELPANQRHAWAEGGKAAREQIAKDAVTLTRLNERTFHEIATKTAPEARSSGKTVGHNLSDGIAEGITEHSTKVTAAARQVVSDAIAAANHAAGAFSPSKVMMKLGLDMMEGLYIGISDGAQKVIDAAKKPIQKLIDGFKSDLDKVKGLAKDFADTIKSGFSSFLDIGGAFGSAEAGTPLSDVIAQQLGGAQQLADVLKALKAQGAGKALLSQVAQSGAAFGQTILQGGPEQVQEMNNALQEIADLAQQTGKGLSEAFFGDRIDKVSAKLDKQNEKMQELIDIEKLGHTHAIVLDGVKVTESIRSELIKTGKRNDGTGIN